MAGRLKGKKGSLLDILFIGVIVLFFAMVVLIGYKITTEYNTNIQANALIPAEAKTASTQLLGFYPGVIDNTFLFFTVGLAMAALTLAALVRVHPIFIPLFIIALFILAFICGIFSNIYQEMAASTELVAQADNLTFISNILGYLPIFVFVFGILLMILMYKLGSIGTQ